MKAEGRLPDTLVACIGGGSNAMGLFHPFLDDPSVAMIGVEAGGHGIETGLHAASLNGGVPGVLHGNRTYLLQDDDGQIHDAHSISAGLDYPGIGPEHAWLHDLGRVQYVSITDREALEAFQLCSRQEGIIPALEPAHALAHVAKIAPTLPRNHLIVMNMCGRGDKDIFAVADHLGVSCDRMTVPRGRALGRGDALLNSRAKLHARVEPGKGMVPGIVVTRIERRFAKLREEGRAGLVIYLTAGDPDPDTSLALFAGARRGRRRSDRDRHAVLRPDGRRPGDPGGRASAP